MATRTRLRLGPIVGHTDTNSTRIWIRSFGNPQECVLRVARHGAFPFVSTELGGLEFGTAVATATDLRSDWRYRYQVLRNGRVMPGAVGSFRTMPAAGSVADVEFLSLSCSHFKQQGAWQLLRNYVREAEPRFILMMGDQVYVDEEGSVWKEHRDSPPSRRRAALAQKYQDHWSQQPLATVLANTPTYMVWDDHEIRDGWGSSAGDSPTLAARYPRGQKIYTQNRTYFLDAYDVYWHFQACHNPYSPSIPFPSYPPAVYPRPPLPYSFRCGRLAVFVTDGRSVRDLWRQKNRILGDEQWRILREGLETIPSDIDALAIVTAVPIVDVGPNAEMHRLFGERFDDVQAFSVDDADEIERIHASEGSGWELLKYKLYLKQTSGDFKLNTLNDVRDKWSHQLNRDEQAALIQAAADSAFINRPTSSPRRLVFLGGDIHLGALFDIDIKRPRITAQCLVSSGISQLVPTSTVVGTLVESKFEVTRGIRAKLKNVVVDCNFGITSLTFTGRTPILRNSVAHKGSASYFALRGSVLTR